MPFQKGNKLGNREGRPRQPEIELLRKAIATVEVAQKKSLYQHLVEQAFKDNAVLVALTKKFVPDITKSDVDVHIPKGITINFSDGKKIEA